MAEMRASPVVNPYYKRIAEVLADLQGPMGQIIPGTDFNPFQVFAPKASTFENLAYGNSPFSEYSGVTNRRLPIVKTGREGELTDIADVALMATGVRPALRGVKVAADEAGDAMVQFLTGNPKATAMGVLDEAGQMAPLSRIFVGRKSATWDAQKEAQAEALEKAGASPERIWRETQLARLPAGRDWVSEIPDDMAHLSFESLPPARERFDIANAYLERKGLIPADKKGVLGVGSSSDLIPEDAQKEALQFADDIIASGGNLERRPLERYFQHQALREAYPGSMGSPGLMGSLDIAREPVGALHRGMYKEKEGLVTTGGGNMVNLSQYLKTDPAEEAKSTLIHELQHAVQSIEDFGRGGNPMDAAQQLIVAERRDPALIKNQSAYQDFKRSLGDLGLANRAQYMYKLDDIMRGERIRPRALTSSMAWYEYADDYRSIAGPQPKRAGPARDEWFRGAAAFIKNKIKEKDPSYRFVQEDYTRDEAKKLERAANRKLKKVADQANEYRAAQSKYRKLNEIARRPDDYELYRRLEGEAISRLAQTRMNLTPAERAANFPFAQKVENAGFNRETINPYGLDVDPLELFVYRY
jgi:hypothetical protein